MNRLKLWLILFSIILILLDKFSFISNIRDYTSVYMQKQINLVVYRAKSYPKLVLLQKSEQQQLQKENVQLKQQVEQYSILLKQKNNQGLDAKALEALKAKPKLYDDFHITVARAIIDVNYLINNKLLIDQGSNNGIENGNAVVNQDGVVGQISIANKANSQLMLITNPGFKIYLQNSVTKSKMLAQGIGNNNLIVKYINKNEKIQAGDILVTTGLDDVYPANIPVAKVIKIFYENNGFNSAICEPVINFNKLQYILVLKNAH